MLNPLKRYTSDRYAVIENGWLYTKDTKEPYKLDVLLSKRFKGYFIYTFDKAVFEAIKQRDLHLKLFQRNGHILGLKVELGNKHGSITFCDAANFFDDDDHPESLHEAIDYLHSLCAKSAITPAGFALNLFRIKYQKKPLHSTSIYAEKAIREAYAGGRTEILQSELKEGFYFDVNSMYPSVMTEPMPCGFCIFTTERNKNRIGFYKVSVNQKHLKLPPLWKKINGALCFPADEFIGWFSSAEIDNAIEAGAKIKIEYGYEFSEKRRIFKKMMTDLYKERLKGGYKKGLTKKILNSFYGKFGAKREINYIERARTDAEYADIVNNRKAKIFNENNLLYFKTKFLKQKYILPYLSAYIVSLGRVKLYKQATEIMNKGGKVAYMATDSLFTDTMIKTSDKLGGWGFEGVVKEAKFKALNTYKCILNEKEIIKAGGINAEQSELKKYMKGQTIAIKKKGAHTETLINQNVKLSNEFFKRNVQKHFSEPLSIGAILSKMKLTG